MRVRRYSSYFREVGESKIEVFYTLQKNENENTYRLLELEEN